MRLTIVLTLGRLSSELEESVSESGGPTANHMRDSVSASVASCSLMPPTSRLPPPPQVNGTLAAVGVFGRGPGQLA